MTMYEDEIYYLTVSSLNTIELKKVKDNEYMIQDVLNKGKQVSIKKTVWTNLGILALCIPLAILSFWYYFVFQVS